MKYEDWLKEKIDLDDILFQCNLDKHDRKQWGLRDSGYIPEPIGVQGKLDRNALGVINGQISKGDLNKNLMWSAFKCNTDIKRTSGAVREDPSFNREIARKTLVANGYDNRGASGSEYLKQMCLAKFTASPEGNGIDCRHWKALLQI